MTKRFTIGFAPMSEHSSFNAALGLARVVEERGHRAVFFVSERTTFADLVRSHGFSTARVPPGHEAHLARTTPIARFRVWKRLQRRAQSILHEQVFLIDSIRANALDLCFLDSLRVDLYPQALALATAGVPCIMLSYTFGSRPRTIYPPLFSPAMPRGGTSTVPTRVVNALRWTLALCGRGASHAFSPGEYAGMVARKWLDQLRGVSFERRLRLLGVRSVWNEWKRRPDLPEIVFGHRGLDWPAIATDPARCYFGTTDCFRAGETFEASILAPGKPVAYCNLSTINGFENISASQSRPPRPNLSRRRFRMAKRYLDAVLGCFKERPDWELLLACGPFHGTLAAEALPSNIHVFERLPQLAVLRHADVAITWGGAGTVRECINHGVPMVILPAWTDQTGNAARVAFHGVGVRGDISDITPAKLTGMVERALGDASIRSSLAAMKAQCDPEREIEGLVRFVESRTGLRI